MNSSDLNTASWFCACAAFLTTLVGYAMAEAEKERRASHEPQPSGWSLSYVAFLHRYLSRRQKLWMYLPLALLLALAVLLHVLAAAHHVA